MSWYDQAIEPQIRPLVKLLRDNGYNTFTSCGHDMTVSMENYDTKEIDRLVTLLLENDYKKFIIEFTWNIGIPGWTRNIKLWIGDKCHNQE